MQTTSKKYLELIPYTKVFTWSTYALLGKNLIYTQKYPFVRIGNFLFRNKAQVNIQNGEQYKRPTIKINGKGISIRDEIDGKLIGTKNQSRIKENQFLLSKIDARNGAFGVVPKELNDGIITGNFWTFDVNYSLINPHYLTLLTGTKEFQKLCQSASVGTTNRNYLQEELFLNFEIPLPSLDKQEILVNNYVTKINRARILQKESNDLEDEIEKYFLEQLGLTAFSIKTKSKGLLTVSYEELDRWDFFSTDVRISSSLRKSHFQLKTIGSAFKIAKRAWNKRKYDQGTFKYIEIGAIDPTNGISEARELLVSNAPSRATQIVKESDLIIGTTRPYLKKFAIVTSQFNDNVCSSGFVIFESSDNYYLPYLLQFLKCTYGVEQLKNRMTGGLYPAITENELKEIKIPLPEVEKQKEIMELVKLKETGVINNKALIEQISIEADEEFENAIFNT